MRHVLRSFIIFFCRLLVVGLLLLAQSQVVNAQTVCCIAPQIDPPVSCRILPQGGTCLQGTCSVVSVGFTHRRTCKTSDGTVIVPEKMERTVVCKDQAICRQAISKLTNCSQFNNDSSSCSLASNCFYYNGGCFNINDAGACTQLNKEYCGAQHNDGSISGSRVCVWDSQTNQCLSRVEQNLSARSSYSENSLLIKCAALGNCRNVNDFLLQLLKFTKIIFQLIGTVAFFFFVFGGFTIILSFGSPEKVQKGKEMLTAAVIGIIIIFTAYIAITFLLDTLGVSGDLRTLL